VNEAVVASHPARGDEMRAFYNLLGNNLIANITNSTVWFALTFWVYLETRSVSLVFTIAGIVGVIVTILALRSKYYRDLSKAYARAPDAPVQA
jgi:hypothetical protein